jgi:hypothetical protein
VLVAMGAFIPEAGGARGAAFATAAAVLFAVLALLWLLAARGDRPEYRRSSRLFVTGTAACAAVLAGTALLPASARIPAWGLLDAAYLERQNLAIIDDRDIEALPLSAHINAGPRSHASKHAPLKRPGFRGGFRCWIQPPRNPGRFNPYGAAIVA